MKRSVLFLLWAVTILSANALEVTIHGLNYFLDSKSHEAVITSGGTCSGELDIPSEVCYNGETFVVKSMIWKAFDGLVELTKVRIPKTLESIMHEYPQEPTYEDVELPYVFYPCTNPFTRCTSLESIEVDEENPGMKSVGGVLFSKDGTWLYAYPAGIKAASYDVPQGVTQVGTFALANENLKKVDLAESVQAVGLNICYDSSLDTLIIRGRNVEDISMRGWFLECLNDTAKLYVPASEVERYKSLYSGTVLPLEEYEGRKETQEYFPEGTKWTEIRLDTLKYDSWYSKVGDEWMPNFETIEYRVQGIYSNFSETFGDNSLKCVYTNCSEWTDSLSLLIVEGEINEYLNYGRRVMATVPIYFDTWDVPSPAMAYNFDWRVGMPISFIDILSTTYDHNSETAVFGIIEEINEGNFGGVRPLNYTDVNGVRIIQGIGVTTWNDGECIFGPVRPYDAMAFHQGIVYPERHYRSILVHFERDGEVLYNVWPEKEAIEVEPVTFTTGQMATIILPTTPDANKGKYYRLDRCEGNEIIFEQELQPCAHVPYIIVPHEDFSIEVSAMELDGLHSDTARVEGISFIGTYQKEEVESQEGFYIELIDTTPDCSLSGNKLTIGALRAYLLVRWDDPYNHGGTKVPAEKMQIVLRDDPNSIQMVNGKSSNGKCYDLSGKLVNHKSLNHKLPHGIYIKDGRKELK